MKSLTNWKVYKYTTNGGETKTVLIGLDPERETGIIEEVFTSGEGTVNDYKLYGEHNHYFAGFEDMWMRYRATHDINSVTDESDNY